MNGGERLRLIATLLVAAAAIAALIVLAFFEPKLVAAGWLIGFLFWSQVPIGSLVLSMIYVLTGGRWGESLRPVLLPATASVPWLFIAIVPVFLAIPLLYPWTVPNAAVKPDVAADYLNMPFFIVRSLLALAVFSAFSLLLRRSGGRFALLAAGLGMLLYGIMISSVAIDWFLTLEPPFVSSSFGTSVGIMQLVTAMAWAALLAPERPGDPVAGDIGGLLLAFLLGITYVDFMALLVLWYGDLPAKVFWFVERDHFPWTALAGAWFVLGSVAPIFALFLARVRNSRRALRVVATSVFAGSALYIVYLVAPHFGVGCLIPAALALLAIGLIQSVMSAGASLALSRREAVSAHGC
ncbi:MAG: hypothetical protein WBF58_14280 [Xanthobacteraceae bacterium]